MQALEAIDGKEYYIRRRNSGYEWQKALCQGWNASHNWILFLVFDDNNYRKILTVMPNEEVHILQEMNNIQ